MTIDPGGKYYIDGLEGRFQENREHRFSSVTGGQSYEHSAHPGSH